ncbi:Isopentenyl-diphosphate delta-isomerase, partial [Globisporangium splendens]
MMPMLRSATTRFASARRQMGRMSSTATAARRNFEDLTAGADAEQLEFMKEMVIQVDEQDRVLGPITKKDSHFHDGVLHRAFSIFVFNSKNELLIQKRTPEKITFPGYWANTCCSHPLFLKDELEDNVGVKRAAIRKLEHELGIPTTQFDVQDIKYVSTVLYKAASDPNWTEYEMDHILLARGDVALNVNPNEVDEVEYVSKDGLPALLNDSERKLSPWFRLICAHLLPKWWENLDTLLEKDNSDRSIHDYR